MKGGKGCEVKGRKGCEVKGGEGCDVKGGEGPVLVVTKKTCSASEG